MAFRLRKIRTKTIFKRIFRIAHDQEIEFPVYVQEKNKTPKIAQEVTTTIKTASKAITEIKAKGEKTRRRLLHSPTANFFTLIHEKPI